MPYRIEAADVSAELAARTEHVVACLLGTATKRSANELRFGNKGSLKVNLSGAYRGSWYDFEVGKGGDLIALIMRERGVSFVDALDISASEFLDGSVSRLPAIAPQTVSLSSRKSDAPTRTTAIARRLWAEAEPITGTLGEIYFAKHRELEIERLGDLSHAIRFHTGIDTVLCLMTHPATNEPGGVHQTHLNRDGTKRYRNMLGRQGVVRLSPDEDVTFGLGISEGIEDGLAVLLGQRSAVVASGFRPVWAMTCCGVMGTFPVLDVIEALTIFPDSDPAGMKSARACADRWFAHGRDIRIDELPRKVA